MIDRHGYNLSVGDEVVFTHPYFRGELRSGTIIDIEYNMWVTVREPYLNRCFLTIERFLAKKVPT